LYKKKWHFVFGNTSINNKGIYAANGNGYPGGRFSYHSIAALSNDDIIIFGGEGYDGSGNLRNLNDLWLFNYCNCVHGYCILNETTCYTCDENYFGQKCDMPCTCKNGTCNDGINGDGLCSSCFENYYGINCNNSCACVNGTCSQNLTGNGACDCFDNYIGRYCDERCIFADCSASCIGCGEFQDQILAILQGNATFETYSNINFTSTQLFIYKNFDLANMSLMLDSSSIVVQGCIHLNNVTLTLNLTNIKSDEKNFTILNSTSGCLDVGNYSITYLNKPECTNITSQKDSAAIVIVLATDTNCLKNQETNSNEISVWAILIPIISVVFILIILIFGIILLIPDCRRKIIPEAEDIIVKKRITGKI